MLGYNSIEWEIEKSFWNYDYEFDPEVIKAAYDYLLKLDEYEGIEYRFLCWLNYCYGFEIPVNKAHVQLPKNLDISSFKQSFLFSDQRIRLFSSLESFIETKKRKYRLPYIEVVIGGSFLDNSNYKPNDIDAVVLVPPFLWEGDHDDLNEKFLFSFSMIPKGLDLKILPENYSLNKFKAFSNLLILGNRGEFPDKFGAKFKNNIFEKINTIKVKI